MAGFMDPILAQIARQGDIMMYGQQLQRQRQQDEQAQRQQGLQERQTLAQLAALEQQQALGDKRRQTLADLVKPRQVGGPLAGVDQYQPVGMQTPQFDDSAAYQALMGIGDVEGAMQFRPKASEGFTLGEGQARFDSSGRPIARLAPASGLTGDAKNLEAILGRKPTRDELIDFKKAGATSVNVGVNTGRADQAGLVKLREAIANKQAEDFQSMQNTARLAGEKRYGIQMQRATIEQGFKTGAFAPFLTAVASVAEGLGADPTKLKLPDPSKGQVFEVATFDSLLKTLQQQKGPQTEGDAQRALKTFAQMKNTTEANMFILDYMEALSERQEVMADFITDKMLNEYNAEPDAFNRAEKDFRQWARRTPLVAASKTTGLPVTFSQYKESALANGVQEEQIEDQWRKFAGVK